MKVWDEPPGMSAVAGVGPEVCKALPVPESVSADGVAAVAVA